MFGVFGQRQDSSTARYQRARDGKDKVDIPCARCSLHVAQISIGRHTWPLPWSGTRLLIAKITSVSSRMISGKRRNTLIIPWEEGLQDNVLTSGLPYPTMKEGEKDYSAWNLGGQQLCRRLSCPLLPTSCLSERGAVLAHEINRIILRVAAMYQAAFDWLAVKRGDIPMLWGSSSCCYHTSVVRHRRKRGDVHLRYRSGSLSYSPVL